MATSYFENVEQKIRIAHQKKILPKPKAAEYWVKTATKFRNPLVNETTKSIMNSKVIYYLLEIAVAIIKWYPILLPVSYPLSFKKKPHWDLFVAAAMYAVSFSCQTIIFSTNFQ